MDWKLENPLSVGFDGLEKYVKECILNGKIDFFPKRDTLSFHKKETLNKEI